MNIETLVIGHRGCKGEIMENTLNSILYAIESGVNGIEFDIHCCSDGELILFHDHTLDRLVFKDSYYFGKIRGKHIKELQWNNIKNTELIDTLGRKYKIPRLETILRHSKVYDSNIIINIEIKDNLCLDPLATMISELVNEGLYKPNRFLISSELLDSVIYMYEYKEESMVTEPMFKDMNIGLVVSETNLYLIVDENNDILTKLTHIVIDNNIINNDIIDHLKNIDIDIYVYTINDYSDINFDKNVNGIITDRPNIFI